VSERSSRVGRAGRRPAAGFSPPPVRRERAGEGPTFLQRRGVLRGTRLITTPPMPRPAPPLDLTITAAAGKPLVAYLRRHLRAAHAVPEAAAGRAVGRARRRRPDVRPARAVHERPGPTDVLTFPLDEDARGRVTAGEVVVCVPEARRRAKAEGTDLRREVLLYALHGMLHLSGYDDTTPAAFARMHRAEDRILSQIGVGAVFATPDVNMSVSGLRPRPAAEPLGSRVRRTCRINDRSDPGARSARLRITAGAWANRYRRRNRGPGMRPSPFRSYNHAHRIGEASAPRPPGPSMNDHPPSSTVPVRGRTPTRPSNVRRPLRARTRSPCPPGRPPLAAVAVTVALISPVRSVLTCQCP
jgi:probable rRNA maturation factor